MEKISLQPDKIYALQEVCNNFLYNSTMRLKQLKAYMNFDHGMQLKVLTFIKVDGEMVIHVGNYKHGTEPLWLKWYI